MSATKSGNVTTGGIHFGPSSTFDKWVPLAFLAGFALVGLFKLLTRK